MGAYQRRKGHNAEREVVNRHKAVGINAKRISMMETNGIDKGDIQIAEKYIGSVKVGQQVPKFIKDSIGAADFLFTRRDKEKWLVTMSLEMYTYLLLLLIREGGEKHEHKTN